MSFKDAKKGNTLCHLRVLRREQISPHVMRVTFTGEDLATLPQHGYDQWFRIFLPQEQGETQFDLPEQLTIASYYLKYKRIPAEQRPVMRNYSVRELRTEQRELDVDFVVHGDHGPASRFAQRAEPGTPVALIDQGRGYEASAEAKFVVLAADETGMFGLINILRDLPRQTRGVALFDIPDAADAQPVEAPEGVQVRWLARQANDPVGALALAALRELTLSDPEQTSAYLVGERTLPTEGRRVLVSAGVPKGAITFMGFWRTGKAAG